MANVDAVKSLQTTSNSGFQSSRNIERTAQQADRAQVSQSESRPSERFSRTQAVIDAKKQAALSQQQATTQTLQQTKQTSRQVNQVLGEQTKNTTIRLAELLTPAGAKGSQRVNLGQFIDTYA